MADALGAALRFVHQGQVAVGVGEAGIALDRLQEAGSRLGEITQGAQAAAELVPGDRVRLVEAERAPILRGGFVQPACRAETSRQAQGRAREGCVEAQGELEAGDGLACVARVVAEDREVGMRRREPGLQRQGAFITRRRFGGPSGGLQGVAEVVVGVGVPGVRLHRASDQPDGVIDAAVFQRQDAGQIEGVRLVRSGAQDLVVKPLRRRPAAGAMMRDRLHQRLARPGGRLSPGLEPAHAILVSAVRRDRTTAGGRWTGRKSRLATAFSLARDED